MFWNLFQGQICGNAVENMQVQKQNAELQGTDQTEEKYDAMVPCVDKYKMNYSSFYYCKWQPERLDKGKIWINTVLVAE